MKDYTRNQQTLIKTHTHATDDHSNYDNNDSKKITIGTNDGRESVHRKGKTELRWMWRVSGQELGDSSSNRKVHNPDQRMLVGWSLASSGITSGVLPYCYS